MSQVRVCVPQSPHAWLEVAPGLQAPAPHVVHGPQLHVMSQVRICVPQFPHAWLEVSPGVHTPHGGGASWPASSAPAPPAPPDPPAPPTLLTPLAPLTPPKPPTPLAPPMDPLPAFGTPPPAPLLAAAYSRPVRPAARLQDDARNGIVAPPTTKTVAAIQRTNRGAAFLMGALGLRRDVSW
jgi:hypothetical protein